MLKTDNIQILQTLKGNHLENTIMSVLQVLVAFLKLTLRSMEMHVIIWYHPTVAESEMLFGGRLLFLSDTIT